MRGAALLLPLLLAGCLEAHCGPTPDEVSWREPELAGILARADPEGWDVHSEPRPDGFPVEHAWLQAWNASVRSIGLEEPLGTREDAGHGHARHLEAHVRLTLPAHVSVDLLADQDPAVARPAVLRFLEALTDGDATEREAWADDLLSEADVPPDRYPAPEHRSFTMVPYEADLDPGRLRVQAFVDENLPEGEPTSAPRSGDWWFQVDYAETVAVRGGQEFRASPDQNRFRDGAWREDYGDERALEDFRAAHASLGVGAAPQDVELQSSIC